MTNDQNCFWTCGILMMASSGKSILLTGTHLEFFRPVGRRLREAKRLRRGRSKARARHEMPGAGLTHLLAERLAKCRIVISWSGEGMTIGEDAICGKPFSYIDLEKAVRGENPLW